MKYCLTFPKAIHYQKTTKQHTVGQPREGVVVFVREVGQFMKTILSQCRLLSEHHKGHDNSVLAVHCVYDYAALRLDWKLR